MAPTSRRDERYEDQQRDEIATLVNYGIHAEELGFSSDDQDRLHLASDWPHFARTALEDAYGGIAVANGRRRRLGRDAEGVRHGALLHSVDTHSKPGNGGCRTIYDTSGTYVPYGYDLSNRARGERIALWAERALDGGRPLAHEHDRLRAHEPLHAPRQRALSGGGAAGVFTYKKILRERGRAAQAPNGKRAGQPGEDRPRLVHDR